jgi:succinate dehydrogenase / fumarate reductase, iron-sulfur subunit
MENPEKKRITFSIYRYNPEIDAKPYMKEYALEIDDDKDMMLLQALGILKNEQDETISFRRSCGEGVCGSDAMNINGTNGLACITPLLSLKQPITLRPLPGLPVIRDLIVDMKPFMDQYERVKPYLQNDEAPPPKERLQTPEERAKLDGLYECILCGCCTSACPSYWWNPDEFLGPAALLTDARFIFDSRDTYTEERLDDLQDPFSLFRCRGIMNCVSVCPKGLNPTAAIGEVRDELIKRGV